MEETESTEPDEPEPLAERAAPSPIRLPGEPVDPSVIAPPPLAE